MESASSSDAVGLIEPITRGRFTRIMGKSVTSDTRNSHESGEHRPASRASSLDSTSNRPSASGTTYTLRIKPDRRRLQVPIAPGSDRRRSR
jgi:hypothetical protein